MINLIAGLIAIATFMIWGHFLLERTWQVADAAGRVHGGERRNVVAFQRGVRSRSSGQAVGLPFEVGVLDVLAADVRDERGFFRRDVVDHIRQVFTDTDSRIAGESICNNSH